MSRPICGVCSKRVCERGFNKLKDGTGSEYWRQECRRCRASRMGTINKRDKYKMSKGDSCETCGFEALHKSQLDVDHIDGDHNNNSVDNLQTLCANCHRLKTYLNKDYLP